MALRDQPYLPLYVQDYITDERLAECSAAAQGVYIRIMLLLHKTEIYGKIFLRQKDRQNIRQIENFAEKLTKHLPFKFDVILSALEELVDEKVLKIEDDCLFQKRMVKDGEISESRSNSGKEGANATNKNKKKSAKSSAKVRQNTEYEIDNDIEYENEIKEGGTGEEKSKTENPDFGETDDELPMPGFSFQYPVDVDLMVQKVEADKENFVRVFVQRGFSQGELSQWLQNFCACLKLAGETRKTEKDFRRHFANWLPYQDRTKCFDYTPVKESKKIENETNKRTFGNSARDRQTAASAELSEEIRAAVAAAGAGKAGTYG